MIHNLYHMPDRVSTSVFIATNSALKAQLSSKFQVAQNDTDPSCQ